MGDQQEGRARVALDNKQWDYFRLPGLPLPCLGRLSAMKGTIFINVSRSHVLSQEDDSIETVLREL